MARLFPILTSLLLAGSPFTAEAQEFDTTPHRTDEHVSMDHGAVDPSLIEMPGMDKKGDEMKGMDHSGHAMPATTDSDKPGDASPPPVPTDFPAERFSRPIA
jgi:copper resistance protein B